MPREHSAVVPVLIYHHVDEIPKSAEVYPGMAMPPEKFEAQMRYLADRHFRCLALDDVVRCYLGVAPVPKRSVAITFDDGYRDNYKVAWPILKRYDLTATVFLVANQIGKTNSWDHASNRAVSPLMSVDEIREMEAAGISFGSHTLSHASLPGLSDREARREIAGSRRVLEGLLDSPVRYFSYPYDRVSGRVLDIVSESGYAGAFGSSSLPNSQYNLWRIECHGQDSMALFRLKVSGRYDRIMWLRDQTALGEIGKRTVKWIRQAQ